MLEPKEKDSRQRHYYFPTHLKGRKKQVSCASKAPFFKRKINIVYPRINMESRKPVLMNLFTGRDRDADREERLCGHSGEGEGGVNLRNALAYTQYHVQNGELVGSCCAGQGSSAQLPCDDLVGGLVGEGVFKKEDIIYMVAQMW